MKRIGFLMLILWLVLGQMNTVSTHGLDPGNMSVLIETVNARVAATPYASAFPFADDNKDNLLSAEEVDTHLDAIHASIMERIVLRNEDGLAAKFIEIDVAVPEEPGLGKVVQFPADFVHILVLAEWPAEPEIVEVEYTLFGSAEESIKYLMQDQAVDTVIEGEFSSTENTIRLRGEAAPTEGSRTIWLSGVEHVLSGYDHILFILALVLATSGLRKLIGPLTAFTLAHTITLAAVAFGFEPPIPPWLIEALIAASIAILAGIYLLGITVEVWWVVALLGLVHGLSFGQALTASLGSLQQWGTTLIAITIGIELTHLVIALEVLGILWLIPKPEHKTLVRNILSGAILCISLYWTFERIPI